MARNKYVQTPGRSAMKMQSPFQLYDKKEGEPEIVSSKPAKPGQDGYGATTPAGTRYGVDAEGNEYSLAPDASTMKGKFQNFMNQPYKPSGGFKLPKINPKVVGGSAVAGGFLGYAKGTGAVKDAKGNLATAESNVASTKGEFDRATSLKQDAQNMLDNYCTQGINGVICQPTAQGIQDGTVTVDNFNHLANMNAGNITGGSGQPWEYGAGYMSSENINETISQHNINRDAQQRAQQQVEQAKKQRRGSVAKGVLFTTGTSLIADVAIKKIKEKIKKKKEEKKKPKFD